MTQSKLLQLDSEWDGDSEMRVRVREIVCHQTKNRKVLVDVTEIARHRTSMARATRCARKYAQLHGITSRDFTLLSELATERKLLRFDGSSSTTRIKLSTFVFGGVE